MAASYLHLPSKSHRGIAKIFAQVNSLQKIIVKTVIRCQKDFFSYYSYPYTNRDLYKNSLIAGNFLEIKGLVKLMVKAVALQIQGKPVEEIRKTFQIEDPKWSPEELAKLKEENAWA